MSEQLFAVSVMRNFGKRPSLETAGARPLDSSALPSSVKAGFRNRYWNVFSSGWEIPVADATATMFGTSLRLKRCLWFESGVDRMNGLYGENHVVVLEFEPVDATASGAAANIKANAPVLEMQMLRELCASNPDLAVAGLLGAIDHGDNKPSFKFYHPDAPRPRAEATLPFLLAFYHMAIVTLYRIERHQWSVPIAPGAHAVDYDSMQAIALARAMLLGFDRDFMTLNQSEVVEIAEECAAIDADLRLREQFGREVELNASMEQHLNNVTQVSQAKSSATSGQALTVLAVLGVPLSIVGTVLSYWGFQQPAGPLVGSPLLWGLVAISTGVPLAVFGLFGLYARMRASRKSARVRG